MSKPFRLRARIESFGHAFRGLALLLRSEHNAWIHAVATLVVVVAGLAFEIDRAEWIAVLLAIAIVWAAEAFNTAIELLCDEIEPDRHPVIRNVKDVAAAGVLVCALGAAAVAAIVFGRRILHLFE
jgi:diacylglycerol kinase (ATP)